MALPEIVDISKTGNETGETVADKVNNSFEHIREAEGDVTALDLRISQNEFDINDLETVTIPDIETDISNLDLEKINKDTTGLLAARANNDLVNELTTSYSKVRLVDTVGVSQANEHMAISIPNDNITINTTGVYKLRASGTITAPSNAEVQFAYFLNGTQINPGGVPVFEGKGTSSPVLVIDSDVVSLSAGDVLEIRGKSDGSNTVTVKSMTFTIEKTFY